MTTMMHDPVVDFPLQGRVLSPFNSPSWYVAMNNDGPRVLQLTQFDPGCAAYRYHSAFNSAPGGQSAFARFGHSNPFCDLRQLDGARDRAQLQELFRAADVIHVHMDYTTLDSGDMGIGMWPTKDQLLIRHYHGSEPASYKTASAARPILMQRALDDEKGAVHVGARLYHHRFSDRMHWVPIPMPCEDYAALAREQFIPIGARAKKNFRIAHSASNPRIKGTVAFQTAVQDLRDKGMAVEAVLIVNMSHREALRVKATCDATFDSFWLGLQGSGLEAAAMGQPVIAGDAECRDEYVQHVGFCPYTFAEDYEAIKPVIERMVTDDAWREAEAHRVRDYTRLLHDYPVVGERYWQIVADEQRARGLA